MDIDKQIFEATFASLQGHPANTESFRAISRACVRCAMLWLDVFAQFGDISDEQLVAIAADIAREELASLRQDGDRLNIKVPHTALQ